MFDPQHLAREFNSHRTEVDARLKALEGGSKSSGGKGPDTSALEKELAEAKDRIKALEDKLAAADDADKSKTDDADKSKAKSKG